MRGKHRWQQTTALTGSCWLCFAANLVLCGLVVTASSAQGARPFGGAERSSADAGAITRVPWPGIAKYGVADLATTGSQVWLATLGPVLKPNLYRLDAI